MLNKHAILLLFCTLFFSCGQGNNYIETIEFSISSPKQGWVYYEDTRVMLAVNVNTSNIRWTSDISGFLGKGNHLSIYLAQGLHRIKAEIEGVSRELSVYVAPNNSLVHTVLLNYTPMEIKMKSGECYAYLYTHNGTVDDFKLLPLQSSLSVIKQNCSEAMHEAQSRPLRDLRLSMPEQAESIKHVQKRNFSESSYSTSTYEIGDKRSFFVINTKNQMGQPHNITAELLHYSDTLSVWVSTAADISGDVLDACMQTVETLIIPRVKAI